MWDWRDEGYRLDDFLVGDANKAAYDKAKKFVELSCGFNLLFVTGNVGSGKTCLAKAVEAEFIVRNKVVKMMNSDQFLGELIWHIGRNIENNGMEVFYKECEKFDILILDDLHFLEGKETTQKYFAYLLFRFAIKQKKVMITSIKELSEYKWLQESLCQNNVQIEQVQIQDADMELKKKILENIQKKWEYKLSKESEDLILENAKNIRQLEGMFKKMMAYVELMGVEIIE